MFTLSTKQQPERNWALKQQGMHCCACAFTCITPVQIAGVVNSYYDRRYAKLNNGG